MGQSDEHLQKAHLKNTQYQFSTHNLMCSPLWFDSPNYETRDYGYVCTTDPIIVSMNFPIHYNTRGDACVKLSAMLQ